MIRLPYGTTESREPVIYVHRFETRDTKTEQRFYAGGGERRLHVSLDSLAPDERQELIDQFTAAKGSYLPFTIDLVGPSGSVESLSVRFAVPRLEVQTLIDASSWASSFDLIVDPGAPPSYTTAATEIRFPGASLQAALLSPVQEVIPLLVITTRAGDVHRVSERACTVDGHSYAAKLLEWDGIRQSLYGADQASFTLANADRAFTTIVNSQNWHAADVQFSLLHVGTRIKVNLWRGHVIPGGWDLSGGNVFRITAADGAYELRLAYPPRKITRQDGFVTPADHQPVNLGKGRNRITATSVVHDTGYGKPLKDIWVSDAAAPLKVTCDVLAGRDEQEFYAALGIVGRGPIGDFGALPLIEGGTGVHYGTIDGQPNHGPGLNGLRRSRGGNPGTGSEAQLDNNPDKGSHILAIDQSGAPLPAQPAPPGAAFLQIRRMDEKGIQADNATRIHEMIAFVSQGNGGYIWMAGVRSWATAITNNAWVAVNVWLRGMGVGLASQAVQETYFNVAAAEALAGICATVAPVLVGSGSEEQFRFVGVIAEAKPLRDWLKEILAGCLGYYTFEFGRLKLGSRSHSGSAEAFDNGNILLNSLSLSAVAAEFNHLSATFADREYGYLSNTLDFREVDHIDFLGQETKADINFSGVVTKSQTSRLVTSLMRENLGGVGEAEWIKARRIGFSTTVLALAVDCGTICSMTHADMPGGSGEFIVEGWTLNRDMSIAIEGRTTTDAMYDMVLGNKPTDVPVNLPPSAVDKLPGLFLYTPVVRDPGFLTLIDCSMTDGSNRGLRSVVVYLVYVKELEPDCWVALGGALGTEDPGVQDMVDGPAPVFAVDDYCLFEDPAGYEIDRITTIAGATWTLQRSWPGNDPEEAIFESMRVPHAAGTHIRRCDLQKFAFAAGTGSFEDSTETGELPTEFVCQIADARVMAVVASASNGYGYSDWVVYNLGAGLSTGNMAAPGATPPGPVTIGTPSYSYLDAEQVEILIPYTPPIVAGSVVGAHVWEEAPDVSTALQAPADGTVAMDGTKNAGGTWNPVDKGKFSGSPVSLIIPSQKAVFTNRYYLVAYSEVAEDTLVQANKLGATPNVVLTIQPAVYQVGVEYASVVTGVSATVEYDDSQVASPKYAIRFRWTPPTERPAVWMRNFGYCVIVYEYDEANRQSPGPEMSVSQTNTLSPWYDLYVGTSVIRCWFVSEDNSAEPRRNTIIPNVTPYVDVTVVWPLVSRPPSGKYADNVTGFAVSSGGYAKGEDGQRIFKINWTWTKPVGAEALNRWGGAVIYSSKPSKPNEVIARTGPELEASGWMEFPDLPITAETWTFLAISRDSNANANTDPKAPVAGTPTATLAVTPAPVDVAPVTGFSVAQPVYGFNGQGVKSLLCVPIFTKPADKAWAYINFYAMVTGDANRYPLGSPIEGGVPGTAYIQDFPVVNEQWTFRAYSVDVNGRESPTYVSSATYTVGPPPVDPGAVTGFSVTTPYYEDNGEGPAYLVIVPNFTKPTGDPNWSYTNFYAQIQEEGAKLWWLNSPVKGGVEEAAIITDFPATLQHWTFWLYSVDIYGKEAPTGLRFPAAGTIDVGPPPNDVKPVTGFTVSAPRYEVNGTGQKTLILAPSFVKPVDVTWAYSNFYKEVSPTTTKDFLSAPAVSGESAKITDYPKANQEWAFYLASVDIYGKEAPLASWLRYPATGTITITPPTAGPTAGAEWTSNVSWSDFGATPYTDSNGVAMYSMSGWFAEPVPADPSWGGVEFRITDDASPANIISTQSGKTSPLTIQLNSPSSSKTHLLYIISFDVNGKLNTIAANTPQRTYVIGNAAGTLDMTKVAAASALDLYVGPSGKIEIKPDAVDTVEIKDDAIKAPKIFTNAVVARTIAAGAVITEKLLADAVTAEKILASAVTTAKLDTNGITVGGGSQMAGVVKVVDAGSSLVAELGKLTVTAGQLAAHGGWFKVIGIGGTNYTTAKVFTDTTGNVTVKDVTLTITNSTTATEVFTEPLMFDTSFGSIVLTVRSTSLAGARAWHLSKGFVTRMGQDWQTSSLNTMASFDRSGELVLYQPDTRVGFTTLNRISIWANGSDGSIRAQAYNTISLDAGGNVSVQFGQSGTYTDPTGKTLVFTKGVLTGRTGW